MIGSSRSRAEAPAEGKSVVPIRMFLCVTLCGFASRRLVNCETLLTAEARRQRHRTEIELGHYPKRRVVGRSGDTSCIFSRCARMNALHILERNQTCQITGYWLGSPLS